VGSGVGVGVGGPHVYSEIRVTLADHDIHCCQLYQANLSAIFSDKQQHS